MYDELVKRLRTMADWAGISFLEESENVRTNLSEAADAIESTSKGYQMMAEAYESEVTKHCWIPVTERLPKKGQVVCVSDGKSTWDYGTFRGVFKVNGEWYWKKRTIKTVKWWMPKSDALPEPPKEET